MNSPYRTSLPVVPARSVLVQRWLAALIVAWLAAGYVVVPWLPESAGWENGWLENTQVAILMLGAVAAAVHARYLTRHGAGKAAVALAWSLVPVWLLLAGRELAWGAVFLPPSGLDDGAPVYSSSVLSYKHAVAPVAALLSAVALACVARFRADRLIWGLLRTRHFPWLPIAIGLCAAALSTYAEGHMGMHVASGWAGYAGVLEEWAEVPVYLALLLAQWKLLDWGPRVPPWPLRAAGPSDVGRS